VTEPQVLVDTGAWLAVFHHRDQYHAPAAAELRRLRAARTPLVVTNLILAELHLHLVHGLGPLSAAHHLDTLKADP
jgi:predicted nucleic acid-binding protein